MLIINEEDKYYIWAHSDQKLSEIAEKVDSVSFDSIWSLVLYDLDDGRWMYTEVNDANEFIINNSDKFNQTINEIKDFPATIVPAFQIRDHEEWELLLAAKREVTRAIILLDGDTCLGVRRISKSQRSYEFNQIKNTRPASANSDFKKNNKFVNIGFSERNNYQLVLDPNITLRANFKYYFWIGIENNLFDSIDEQATSFNLNLPEIKIVLFDTSSGLILDSDRLWGDLIWKNGSYRASQQPSDSLKNENLSRLYFPIKAPQKAGVYSFRCNIYFNQVLLQSRLVKAVVRKKAEVVTQSLRSIVDYNLTTDFSNQNLVNVNNHRLSILINENSNQTQGLKFFGKSSDGQTIVENTSIDQTLLINLSEIARKTLRKISWGSENEWSSNSYRYGGNVSIEQFSKDITFMAIRGYRFYYSVAQALFGDTKKINEMQQLMRFPGYVQIAIKRGGRDIVPAGLFYDYNIDTNAKNYQLCPSFLDSINNNVLLSQTECFLGNCPSREDETTICPSGFWGFRHFLGFPYSGEPFNVNNFSIRYTDYSSVIICVSKDPDLIERASHEIALQNVFYPAKWHYADNRENTLNALRDNNPVVVYFYCHGGKVNETPFLQVGNINDPGITPDNILMKKIHWDDPQPFVFINGCNTAYIDSKGFMEFTSAFIKVANASGVMGTEITVFEPLARKFSEYFFSFFMNGSNVGESVRNARLALLSSLNPLGLVYTPYSMASVKLIKA